jgi:mRNA-degrading endonuclease RelE of RelBE toxin-antitoxin system
MDIDVHENAELDLDALWDSDPHAAAGIDVALDEICSDADALKHLTGRGDVKIGTQQLNVKGWVTARRKDSNLARIRVLDTPATRYRIVFGYHWRIRKIVILAIVHKNDLTYDNLNSEIAKRILADWYEFTGGQAT